MTGLGRTSRWQISLRCACTLIVGALVLLLLGLAAGCGGEVDVGDAADGGLTPSAPGSTAASITPKPKPSQSDKTPAPKPTKAAAKSATRIVFVNVGQGDAIIIKSGKWCGLIDGGPSGSEAAIESSLSRLGVTRLNAVVVTHPHADHTGGLSGVVYDYRPKQAYVGEGAGSASSALRSVGAAVKKVRRGATLRFGALKAKVLSPGSLCGDANEDSVVLLIEAGGKRFLFTGDCTGPSESLVGGICARGPPLYLLKVAHHGSRYSTSPGFLDETHPRFAVISVGSNSYGHPAPETISALKVEGTRVYTTQMNGTVALTVASSGAVTWAFAKSSKPVTKAVTSGGEGTSAGSSGSGGTRVYITETGECYHRAGCRYLSHSKIPISLKDAKARGYRPCSVCKPPN